MINYPDIIIVLHSKYPFSTSAETLASFVAHADKARILIRPNNGFNFNEITQQKELLKLCKLTVSDWVLIIDDDDLLVSALPDNKFLASLGDAVFFSYIKNKKRLSFIDCPIYKVHGNCGIIAKRELVIKALEACVKHNYSRYDIGYVYHIIKEAKKCFVLDDVLIEKTADRLPKQFPQLKQRSSKEIDILWRVQFKEAQNILASTKRDNFI